MDAPFALPAVWNLNFPGARKVISNRGAIDCAQRAFVPRHSSSIFHLQCGRRVSSCIPDYTSMVRSVSIRIVRRFSFSLTSYDRMST